MNINHQRKIDFPVEIEVKEKWLVYADAEYVREYYEPSDEYSLDWGTTKKEYKHENFVVGIVDHPDDVELLQEKTLEKSNLHRYQWRVVSVKLHARPVEHFVIS